MPYQAHPTFQPTEDENTPIWRYMDLACFLAILEGGALFFPSIAKLTEKDPFEGRYSYANAAFFAEVNAASWEAPPPGGWEQYGVDTADAAKNYQMAVRIHFGVVKTPLQGPRMCASCWHISPHESDAMWGLYATKNAGVAIRSSFARLCDSLSGCEEAVTISPVRYVDYHNTFIDMGNLLSPCFHKRLSFAHEHELRAVIMDEPEDFRSIGLPSAADHHDQKVGHSVRGADGLSVPIDVAKLIERVYVSPLAPGWFVDLVKALCKRYEATYKIALPVEYSSLAAPPPI